MWYCNMVSAPKVRRCVVFHGMEIERRTLDDLQNETTTHLIPCLIHYSSVIVELQSAIPIQLVLVHQTTKRAQMEQVNTTPQEAPEVVMEALLHEHQIVLIVFVAASLIMGYFLWASTLCGISRKGGPYFNDIK